MPQESAAARLSWILLASFAALAAAAAPGQHPEESGWRVLDVEDGRDLLHGGRLVLRHLTRFDPEKPADTFRTYDHVAGFHGEGFLTKGPGGKHPHHMGVFAGWNATAVGKDVFDFWHGKNGVTLRHRAYEDPGPPADGEGRMRSVTEWRAGDGRPVVIEDRRVTARLESADVLVLDYEIALAAAGPEPVTLGGDPHHAGFQFRAAQEVADREKETLWLRAEGAKAGKDDVWEDCAWAVCRFTVQGHPGAVQMSDHPSNPRPTSCPTRAYGRFGFFFRARLEPGVPLRLRYRLVVMDGSRPEAADAGSWAARHAAFAR